MIGETRPVALETKVSGGTVVSSEAVSIGLIVIESVINALKHAFPSTKTDGRIIVAYESNGSDWTLSIADVRFHNKHPFAPISALIGERCDHCETTRQCLADWWA
jgi:anti-sigma regulatory factor (Ser/Thr protein kinase)